MQINQLVVLPTEETLEYLGQVFDASPIELDLKAMYVEINSSEEVMEADTTRSYTAYAKTLDRYYDSSTGETSLLLPLVSEALVDRARELRLKAPSAFYQNYYFPFLVIKRNLPPLRRAYRGLVTNWSDTLYSHQQPLFFDAEIVIPKEYDQVPDMDFYTSQIQQY
jgi:hypothetical protein